MISVQQLARSFRHASRGIKIAFQSEQSFRIQVFIAFTALVLAAALRVTSLELILIILLISFVLVLELVNSVLERIVDAFKPRMHPVVGEIKDIMAGAVLVASVVSGAVGLIILVPHVLLLTGVR
jgi:diacylglycerol kinase